MPELGWEISWVAGILREAKRHHILPQFYLRGFADSDRIATVRLPGDTKFVCRIRNTAAINRFYSIEGHPDGADVFEKALSQLEADAAEVIRRIEGGTWPVSGDQREILATFMAVQHLRGQDHRRTMVFLKAQAARLSFTFAGKDAVKQRIESLYGVEVDDGEAEILWRQATQPDGPPVTIAPAAHIERIIDGAGQLIR